MRWIFGALASRVRSVKPYDVQDFVSLVDQFMEQLGIACAPLVGHSMGGTVSLLGGHPATRAGLKRWWWWARPSSARRSPACSSCSGRRPVAYVVHHNLWALKLGFRLLAPLYSRDPHWPDMMDRDLSRTTLESFLVSIASLRRTDLRPQLSQVSVPVMGMYGDEGYRRQPGPVASRCQRASRRPASSASRRRAFHHAGRAG